MKQDNEYCEKHCKGYRDTGGRCFADGHCDAYWEYQKQKGTMKEKKRSKVLSMFYALLLCLFYVALSIGVNILSHKLFGLHCGIDSITFSMVFTIVWWLCYIDITKD